MLVNPTNIDIDSRGRVWVTEGLNYRLTRGGNTRFHRVDDSDKIKILEDTDGDGKADKMTVFADRIFPVPMGIAVEEHYGKDGKYTGCRVFVGNSPDLLVLEDTDGDDRADKRYPLLTGFGGIDSDHGVHGMVLGLDGKLYFTHGDGCCSVQQDQSERQQNFDVIDKSGRHVSSDQLANTLRVNRDGTEFEVICDRQRNNYETCLNAFGNIFTSDNDDDGNRGCRVIWAMDGGHYGYHTPELPGTGARTYRATSPSSWAPATAARRESWSTKGICCPRSTSAACSRSMPAPGKSTFSPDSKWSGVPHRVQGVPVRAMTRGSDPSTPARHLTARSSSPTGTTPASVAMRSATRRPAGSSASRPKGTSARKSRSTLHRSKD